MRRERRALLAAVLSIVVLAACTHEAGPPVQQPANLPLEGTLLVGPGQSFLGVGLYDLATRKLTRIRGVAAGSGFGVAVGLDFFAGAFLRAAGSLPPSQSPSAVVMIESKLYLFQGDRAVRVGPRYRGGVLVAVAGQHVIASRCFPGSGGSGVLDLANPTRWQHLGPMCAQAVSPDGGEVAVTEGIREQRGIFGGGEFTYGSKVWAMRVDGTGSRRLLVDVAAIPALRPTMVADPQILRVAWGKPGLAVAVGNGQSGPWALVFAPASGDPQVIPLGPAQPFDLAWQPNGDLLAFSDCYQCTTFGRNPAHTADVRIWDPETGALRQIAAANNFLSGLVWSPAGDVVATLTSDNDLLFAGAAGRTVVRRSVDAVPEDWVP
ncbi:MAG: hypothetical protein M3Q23_00845 [Actinomycetota bacterium]|nr:hypothetical protein [Actinomycetota bacterium]